MAQARLLDAIDQRDPDALTTAIAYGASANEGEFDPPLVSLLDQEHPNGRTFTGTERTVQGRLVRLLLNAGADPNGRNARDVTALGLAVRNAHTDAVTLLLERGAHPDRLCRDERVNGSDLHLPLMVAIDTLLQRPLDGLAVVRTLLDAGADVHARDPTTGGTSLHRVTQASTAEHVIAMRWLMDAGADPEGLDAQQRSAMAMAQDPLRAEMLLRMERRALHGVLANSPAIIDARRRARL